MSESTINVMTKDDLDAFWSKLKGWFVKAPTATVTADTVALFDGITGKIIKSSGKTIETSATQSSSNLITSGAVWTGLNGKLSTTLKGAANGLAELDANGLVPSSQLPSYVDDVLEYASKSAFPATGETGKIYVALDTNLTYRWSGSAYVEISPSLALGETSSTAYRGDRGAIAYSHATDANRLTTAQTSGFYKFATTAEGHIKSVTAVTASDLTTLIGNTTYAPYNSAGYLPLSGGTMTGALTGTTIYAENVQPRRLLINHHTAAFNDSNVRGCIVYRPSIIPDACATPADRGAGIYFSASATADYSRLVLTALNGIYLDGTVKINNNTAWHAGNDGTGSGLDADLLDGQHGSYYVAKNTIEKSGENLIEGSSNATISSHWSSTGWSGDISTYDASSGVYEVYAYSGWRTIVYQLPDEYLGKTLAFSVDLYYDSDKSTQAPSNEFGLIKAKEYKTTSNTILTIGTSLPAKTWTHYTGTFVANSDVAYFGFFIRCTDNSGKYTYIRARNLKVELGEIQSAWTPAHKDLCFSTLSSNSTNAVSLTIGDVTRNITVSTLRSSIGVTDSSSASAISTSTNLVTERDVYYGLPTINGAHNYTSNTNIYAPTGAGTSGQILKSTAGTPEWINQSAITAGALSTVSKTLFGNTYWTSGGVPTSIGTSSSPAALNYVTNIDSLLYFDRTNNRVGVGTSSPSEKLAVDGNATVYGKVTASNDITSVRNIYALGGMAAYGIATLDMSGGTLGVTQVNVGSTAYTPTNGIVSLPAYPTWSTLTGKPSLAAVATSGDYDDLTNKPTNLSDFTNDASYLTNMAFETKGGVGTVTGNVNTLTYCTSLAFTTFTATLPTITDTTKCYVVMFYVHWKSGYNAYNITSSHTVSFMHDFSIVAGGAYFIKAVFAGHWYVSAERVE